MIATPNNTDGASPRSPPIPDQDSTGRDHVPTNDHPLSSLLKELAELREFFLHYLEARKDTVRATARRLLVRAALVLATGVTGLTLLVAAALLLMNGLADAAGELSGGAPWVGKIAVGGGVLVAAAVLATIGAAAMNRSARLRTIQKYERRHSQQRVRFGHDVSPPGASGP